MSVSLHTSLGDIKLELFCETAPRTCFNFLALAASGYYDGCLWHRNLKGFMIQTGDPTGSGKGGTSIWGTEFGDEFHPEYRHDKRGIVAMANKGIGRNKSQFYILYSPQPHLNDRYTVFGHMIHGFDVLDQMELVPVSEKKHRPTTDIILNSVSIHANPLAERGIVFRSPHDDAA